MKPIPAAYEEAVEPYVSRQVWAMIQLQRLTAMCQTPGSPEEPLADFFDWNVEEAAEAYIFRSDVQYNLNRETGAEVSTRTVERYQKLFRESGAASR